MKRKQRRPGLELVSLSLVFANGPGDRGSIPGRVIPKTQKIVLDAALLSTQYHKVRIKGKVEQSIERTSALPYTSVSLLLTRLRSLTLLTYKRSKKIIKNRYSLSLTHGCKYIVLTQLLYLKDATILR